MDLGIGLALRTLARHKVRSALSILGICIGVGAFICSVGVYPAQRASLLDPIEALRG